MGAENVALSFIFTIAYHKSSIFSLLMSFYIERLGNLQYIFSNLRVNKNHEKELVKNKILFLFPISLPFDSVRLDEVHKLPILKYVKDYIMKDGHSWGSWSR